MKSIWRNGKESKIKPNENAFTPEIIASGHVIAVETDKPLPKLHEIDQQIVDQNKFSYIIMPRLGKNLDEYFEQSKRKMSKVSCYQLGITVLTMLEKIHSSGFVYNDLKLDNLMTDFQFKIPKEGTC